MTYELIAVMVSSIIGAWFAQRIPSTKRNDLGGKVPNYLGVFIVAAIMIVYSGLRNNIGDTVFYIHTYHLLEDDLIKPTLDSGAFIFETIRYMFVKAGLHNTWFITFCAAAFILPSCYVMARYSCQFHLAIYLFFAMTIYTSSMNGIRQYVAVGVVLMATPMLFSPKKWLAVPYCLIVLFAMTIHSSAGIMILIYFVCRRKAWSFPTIAIILASLGVLFFVSQFSDSFFSIVEDTSYSDYQSGWFDSGNEAGTSIVRIIVNCVPMLVSMVYSKKIRKLGPIADILINMSVVNSGIFIVAGYNWIFARFAFYTCVYIVVLMVLVGKTAFSSGTNKFFFYMMVVLYLLFAWFELRNSGFCFYDSEWFTPRGAIPLLN